MWESTIQAFSFLLFIQCRVLHFSLTISQSVCITSLYYLVWLLQFLHWRYNDQTYSGKMRSLEEWKRYNFFASLLCERKKKIAFKSSTPKKDMKCEKRNNIKRHLASTVKMANSREYVRESKIKKNKYKKIQFNSNCLFLRNFTIAKQQQQQNIRIFIIEFSYCSHSFDSLNFSSWLLLRIYFTVFFVIA